MSDFLVKGMVLKGVCEGVGSKGDGVFRVGKSRFVVIVPQAVVGKEYFFELTVVGEKMGFGVIKSEVN